MLLMWVCRLCKSGCTCFNRAAGQASLFVGEQQNGLKWNGVVRLTFVDLNVCALGGLKAANHHFVVRSVECAVCK